MIERLVGLRALPLAMRSTAAAAARTGMQPPAAVAPFTSVAAATAIVGADVIPLVVIPRPVAVRTSA